LIELYRYFAIMSPMKIQCKLFTYLILPFLGFSQGTATMCRWISKDYFKVNDIIFCSGDIPEDVNYKKSKNFTNANTYYLYGDKDNFLTKDIVENLKKKIKKNGLKPVIKEFRGSHQIDEKSVLEIIKRH